jgi:hypothetical protein
MTTRSQESEHEEVLSNLMDLQSRLRGDPSSMILPRRAHSDLLPQPETVAIVIDDVTVEAAMDAEEPPSTEAMIEETADAEARLVALQARLEELQAQIERLERSKAAAAAPETGASVIELQRAVDRRLQD